jgi:hypothetical protein
LEDDPNDAALIQSTWKPGHRLCDHPRTDPCSVTSKRNHPQSAVDVPRDGTALCAVTPGPEMLAGLFARQAKKSQVGSIRVKFVPE